MKWQRESNVKEKPCEQKRDDQKHEAVLKKFQKKQYESVLEMV